MGTFEREAASKFVLGERAHDLQPQVGRGFQVEINRQPHPVVVDANGALGRRAFNEDPQGVSLGGQTVLQGIVNEFGDHKRKGRGQTRLQSSDKSFTLNRDGVDPRT